MTSIQSILMVRPSGFKTNIQTLENNFSVVCNPFLTKPRENLGKNMEISIFF